MREGSLLPERVGTKSVNTRAAARRGGAGIALGEAADSRAKPSFSAVNQGKSDRLLEIPTNRSPVLTILFARVEKCCLP